MRQHAEHAHHWYTPKPHIAARQPLFIAASHYSSTHSFPLLLFAPFGDPAVDPKIGSFRPVPKDVYKRQVHGHAGHAGNFADLFADAHSAVVAGQAGCLNGGGAHDDFLSVMG